MRETRPSGSEGGARFYPSFLPLSVRLSLARLERVAAERMPRCSEAGLWHPSRMQFWGGGSRCCASYRRHSE